jgi:hypothetical protein
MIKLCQLCGKVPLDSNYNRLVLYDWSDYQGDDMYMAVKGEFDEFHKAWARNDIHGPHGQISELIDLINVSIKTILNLSGGKV